MDELKAYGFTILARQRQIIQAMDALTCAYECEPEPYTHIGGIF